MAQDARGYLQVTKACIVQALQAVFNSAYVEDFQNLWVDIEYPLAKQNYPGIWVNFTDTDELAIAGIGHTEFVYDHPDPDDPTRPDPAHPFSTSHAVTRWTFGGEASLTVVALSSWERDRLYDELVRVFAFSRIEEAQTEFRYIIENNPFVAMSVNWDNLRPHGDAAAPGTPWESENEVIYERSVAFDLRGEFVSDYESNTLVALAGIVVTGIETTPDGVEIDRETRYIT